MSSTQNWGRRESWIWPPRGFYFTYGAVFIAAVLCSFFLTTVRFNSRVLSASVCRVVV
jgi:hypothetical protein